MDPIFLVVLLLLLVGSFAALMVYRPIREEVLLRWGILKEQLRRWYLDSRGLPIVRSVEVRASAGAGMDAKVTWALTDREASLEQQIRQLEDRIWQFQDAAIEREKQVRKAIGHAVETAIETYDADRAAEQRTAFRWERWSVLLLLAASLVDLLWLG